MASVAEVVLGQVRQVDHRYGFVVVELLARSPELAPGDTLEIRREGRPAVALRISPQATRRFVVADVVSGEPEVGDDVYRCAASGGTGSAAVDTLGASP